MLVFLVQNLYHWLRKKLNIESLILDCQDGHLGVRDVFGYSGDDLGDDGDGGGNLAAVRLGVFPEELVEAPALAGLLVPGLDPVPEAGLSYGSQHQPDKEPSIVSTPHGRAALHTGSGQGAAGRGT